MTGNFNENGSVYYYQWEGPHFYGILGPVLFLIITILMICVRIRKYQMNKQDENPNSVSTTKDLESILLNFTLVSLIIVSSTVGPLRSYLRKK